MKKVVLFIVAGLIGLTTYAQKELSGVTPTRTIKVGDKSLAFNGSGLREKFFLDLYVGSLYLENKTKNGQQVMDANEPMAITINIVSGLITSEKMIDAVNEGFEKSTKGDQGKFKTEIQQFKNAFKEEIVKGDHYVIAYLPGTGSSVTKNGKKLVTIPGLEFKKALFGIWFCDEPADEDLKEGMLGLED
jgi:hypothetical protein